MLESLTVSTEAPTPTRPPATAMAVTGSDSSIRLWIVMAPPDESVPPPEDVTFVATLSTPMPAPPPTRPPATLPVNVVAPNFSFA